MILSLDDLSVPNLFIKPSNVTVNLKNGTSINHLKLTEVIFRNIAGMPFIGYFQSGSLIMHPMSDVINIDLSARIEHGYVKAQTKTNGVF